MKSLLTTLALLPLAACSIGGSRSASSENDRLRREVLDLTTRIQSLEREREELRVKAAGTLSPTPASLAPEALDALPLCTSISISSLSGLRSVDAGKTLAVMFEPRDGKDRFTQVVGVVTVSAAFLPASGVPGAAPVQTARLSPREVRDAYRSGITGTYYEVLIPAPAGYSPAGGSISLRVDLADAVTGRTITAEKLVPGR
ncbi:MAG: hypothetical protein DYG92_03270 [Leptolyngbya sp. PLA1]|nr:hypothetical protein [Leptolyngbya sp. PLA1]